MQSRMANGLGWFSIGLGLAEIAAPRALAKLIGVNEDSRTRTVLRLYGMREVAAGVGILLQDNPSGWLWARVGGDVLDLSALGKAIASDDTERGKAGVAAAAVAGITALDVYCAQRLSAASGANGSPAREPNATSSIIIDKSQEEIYGFWRNFQNLPLVSPQLESVVVTGRTTSHWKVRSPIGSGTIEWDAEITEDQPNEYLAWRSLSTAAPHAGSVTFSRATGGRGTVVTVRMDVAGIRSKLGKLLGAVPQEQANIMLHNLKQLLETGQVMRSDASIHRGMHPARPPEHYEPRQQRAHGTAAG